MKARLSAHAAVAALGAAIGCGTIIDVSPGAGGDAAPGGDDAATDGGEPPTAGDGGASDAAEPRRAREGLVALYSFDENAGTWLEDRAGVMPPVRLEIKTATTSWGDGGLAVARGTRIESAPSPTRIQEACSEARGFTVEAWVTPAVASQGGPARVVSYAIDTDVWNFVLGVGLNNSAEAQSRYVLRLWTEPELAGRAFALETEPDVVAPRLQHVVGAAAEGGDAKLYVDGVVAKASPMPAGSDFGVWRTDAILRLANEGGQDRSFAGLYSLVAVYCRALSDEEVKGNFAAGAHPLVD